MTITDKPAKKKAGRKVKVYTPGVFQRSFNKKRTDGTFYEYTGDIWQICYSVPKLDGKGTKMVFESSRSKNKGVAETLLNQRKNEVLAKTHPHAVPKNEQTLKEYINDIYLKDREILALRGFHKKELVLNQIKEHLGRWKFNELTGKMIKSYLDVKDEVRAKAKKEPLSVATRNRHIATVKAVYAHAYENGTATEAVMSEMKRLSKGTENNTRLRYLTLTEIPRLFKACEEHSIHLREIVEFTAKTGLRKGRVYLLEWNMLDMEHKYIHLPLSKNGDRFDAPLNSGAMAVLEERLKVKKEESPYVFYNPFDFDRWYDLKEGFHQALEAAGIKDFHFHDLRHTFISHLVMAGVAIAKVQSLAGHKTIAMTMRYAHLSPETLATAVEKLPY